jgi:hypothetical protein
MASVSPAMPPPETSTAYRAIDEPSAMVRPGLTSPVDRISATPMAVTDCPTGDVPN